jgi:hypothetical protein
VVWSRGRRKNFKSSSSWYKPGKWRAISLNGRDQMS